MYTISAGLKGRDRAKHLHKTIFSDLPNASQWTPARMAPSRELPHCLDHIVKHTPLRAEVTCPSTLPKAGKKMDVCLLWAELSPCHAYGGVLISSTAE